MLTTYLVPRNYCWVFRFKKPVQAPVQMQAQSFNVSFHTTNRIFDAEVNAALFDTQVAKKKHTRPSRWSEEM
jgi:hypothetical protein